MGENPKELAGITGMIFEVSITDLARISKILTKLDGVTKYLSCTTIVIETKLDFDEVLDFLTNNNIEVTNAR